MKTMKTISRTLMIIGIMGAFVSCKSSFDAAETMELQNNRQAVYQEIISNPEHMTEFTQMAEQDQDARKIMMQSHMEMMESGKLMEMMKNNPEMIEQMKENMQNMMQNNPEMMENMRSKMTEKMMKSAEGRKKLMEAMQENPEMKKAMMQEMMQNMHNGGMMDEKENDKQ
ncbi:hypothetical protein SAMN04488027_10231 [Psychroflexus sediminis]|uniref:Uncharacterized protein n=2 Tax=Psychroflexus sediminis TaxID=470826 RepID=A0A1G7UEQ3_9FLAO|nr:hypothetical protein SAMN04488027_10231 [Psychroflexus sediminis]